MIAREFRITISDKRTRRQYKVLLKSNMGAEEVAEQVRKVLGVSQPLVFIARRPDGRETQIANPDAIALWEIAQSGSEILVEPVDIVIPPRTSYSEALSEGSPTCESVQSLSIRKATVEDLWLEFDKGEETKALMDLVSEPFMRKYVKEMFKIGVFWVSNGYYDKAVETLKEIVQEVGRPTPVLAYLYSLSRYYYSYFVDSGRSEILREAADDLKVVYSCSGVAKHKFAALTAIIYAELGDLDRAEMLLKESDSSPIVIRLARAHVYRLRGLLGLAEQEVSYVLSHERKNRDAVIEKALVLRDEGRYEDALSLLDKLLYGSPLLNPLNLVSYFPQNTLAMLIRAEILEIMGKRDEALSTYRQINSILYSPIIKSRIFMLSSTGRRTREWS